ncbi:unnamed protein product [Clonostachys rosea]|uniref:Uncharacterized protein n=1 Tax=Bionectria ochroleuca TaxID=29856 RepID=A0ABY6USV0_BIOOC|nr:unnamed protein product [Clonostachys rosea]
MAKEKKTEVADKRYIHRTIIIVPLKQGYTLLVLQVDRKQEGGGWSVWRMYTCTRFGWEDTRSADSVAPPPTDIRFEKVKVSWVILGSQKEQRGC